jgi:hypothetical protein
MEHTVTIKKVYSPDSQRLVVEGTVNGIPVVGEGFNSRIASAKSEAHKTKYMQAVLLAAAIPVPVDPNAVRASKWRSIGGKAIFWVKTNWLVIVTNGVLTYLMIHLHH